MKNLIIYAHPEYESHSQYTLKEVQSILNNQKQKYEIIDLYKIKFNPILTKEEIINQEIDDEIKAFQKQILDSDRLIFIYPIWWNGTPAILKGWFDRVFTSKFAYQYVKKFPGNLLGLATPIPLLNGKKAIVFTSTGAPAWASKLIAGNRFKHVIKKDILGFCGIKAKVYRVDHATKFNEIQMAKIEKTVKNGLN